MTKKKLATFDRSDKLLMSQPLVSIIIPAFNHEKYVVQSIRSVLDQTYNNIELIIIDDGSSDKTPELVARLINDQHTLKIIFIRQENMGVTKTLNKGIQLARGEYIAFLASDDAYLSTRIEEGVKVLSIASRDVCAVYSDGFIINGKGQKVQRFSSKYITPIGTNTYKELLIGNWIAALSVLYRKSALIDCGCFDENLGVEDYDMLIRLSRKYKFVYIPQPLFLYRRHEDNYSADSERMNEQFDLISAKYPDLLSFKKLLNAIMNRRAYEVIANLNMLNIGLLLRKFIRKVQASLGLVNMSYFELIKTIGVRLGYNFRGYITAQCLRFRGVTIGKGSRVFGKVTLIGNKKNVEIGNNVRILGNLRICTEYSRHRQIIHIDDSAVIDNNATLASFGGSITIGRNCFIGPYVHLQAKGDIKIDDFSIIAANTSFFALNHNTTRIDTPFYLQGDRFEGISIGKNCWIGTGVIVLDGATMGDNCIVGAGCIVKGTYAPASKIVAKDIIGKSL